MADEFDSGVAAERHVALMTEIERVRNGISKDVIDYYWKSPLSEEERSEKREGIRKYLLIAAQDIDNILRNWL